MNPKLIMRIRTYTQQVHQSLEDSPGMQEILKQESKTLYASFLLLSLQWIRGLLAAPSYLFSQELWVRRKTWEEWQQFLCMDLRNLSQDEKVATPAFASSEELWGAAYVIEGSALGAPLILSRWSQDESWPRSYLARGQFEAHRDWRDFLIALEAQATVLDEEKVKGTARKVFVSYLELMSTPLESKHEQREQPPTL